MECAYFAAEDDDNLQRGPSLLLQTKPWEFGLEYEPCDVTLKVVIRCVDRLGVEAAVFESDLHERFPGVIPRFWHNRDSLHLVVDAEELDPETHYMTIELPTDHGQPTSAHHQDPQSDDEVPHPSKRPKTSSDNTRNTMKVYLPYYLADFYGLSSITEQLKDSARRSEVLCGFIVSVLGGAPHISYPPTLDQAKLYCEIIALHEHYGIPTSEIVPSFAHTLSALTLTQPVRIPLQAELIHALVEFVWVSCSQSPTCLAVLEPCIVRREKLLERLAFAEPLNPARYAEIRCSKVKNPHQASNDFKSALLRTFQQASYLGNTAFKVFDKMTDDSVPLPPHLFSISSSVVDIHGEKSGMRRLVHTDRLVKHWPYFKSLIDSGLSEARSQHAELPLSDLAIELLIKSFYHTDPLPIPQDTAIELIELGPQIGLYDDW